jgi:prolyl-tRNA editing enzyme YbaK/EbsC (Cys-tRNA(Pro) deacylase)
MTDDLPPAAMKVKAAADSLGLPISIRVVSGTTRTAEEAAAACGCTIGQIVKSLIFKGGSSGRPYLLMVAGTNRVDEKAVAFRIGEAIVRPDAAFARDATGFAIGGIPPFGHITALVPYLDKDLLQYETVWAAAGTHNAVFAVDPAKLRDAVGAEVIPMGREA